MGKFRLLHTSDWHLGHLLHQQPRQYEQEAFLHWLLTTLEDEQIDALVVAGDVFDSPNPSPQSQGLLYTFLAAAKTRLPHLAIVLLAGDHDSPARLDAAHPVLSALGVHVVGHLAQPENGSPNLDRCLIELHGADGAPVAHLAAVPCLGHRYLSPSAGGEDADRQLAELIGSVYRRVCEEIIRRAGGELPSVVAGHLYLRGCHTPDCSDPKTQNEFLAALEPGIFSPRPSYVALGHLHLGQALSDNVYYPGSPLPLSFAEADYAHQVLFADFNGAELAQVRVIAVPCAVPMLRIPCEGPRPPEAVLEEIHQLEKLDGRDPSSPERPYLEVRVLLQQPQPALREEISRALDDKWPRLLAISPEYERRTKSPRTPSPRRGLNELNPEEVFRYCYRRKYCSAASILDEPSEQLMHAFRILCQEQEKGEAG